MSQKFKSDIETQAGLIDSFGFTGTAGQVLSSTGTKTEWITPTQSPGGGGSSQVFYFNGGTASSVGGYYQMSPVANTGTGADFTINANGYIASFLTDVASPNQLNIPAGNWNFEIYFSAGSSGGSPSFYVELYKYSSGGVFTLIASSSAVPEGITNGTAIDAYFTPLAVPATTLLVTDRLAVRVYVTHSGRTITMHTQNGHLSEVITTFSTGLTALNGLTAQVQYFTVGTVGTDFNISSATNTHTFNLPTASAINRGALSSADWITFNSKANASGTTNYVSKFTGATILGNSLIYDNGTNVGIGTSNPDVYPYAAPLSVSGSISSSGGKIGWGVTDAFTAYGNSVAQYGMSWYGGEIIPIAISGYYGIGFFTTGSEKMRIDSSGNVGIGTTSPSSKLDVDGGNINSFYNYLGGGENYNIRLKNDLSIDNGYLAQLGSSTSLLSNAYYAFSGQYKATSTTSSSISLESGNIMFNAQSGLTSGSNFSLAERMRITSVGNVIIGTLGTGLVYSNAGTLTSTNPSDERLKNDITDLDYGLNEILQLRPVTYNWKNDTINQGKQFGFIAQEVQQIMPDLISEFTTIENDEEVIRLGLDKEAIFVVMVNAIKELNSVIEILKTK